MIEERSFSLSVEELILALYVIGCQEAAAGILHMSFDPMSDEELEIRLVTAGHSLAARGWLTVDEAAGTKELHPVLAQTVRAVSDAAHTLRLSKQTQEEETALGIHVLADGTMVAHQVERGFIHRIDRLDGFEEVLMVAERHFGLYWQEETDLSQDEALVWPELDPDAAELLEMLAKAGMPEQLRVRLAEDVMSSDDWLAMMRVEYDQEREPHVEHGVMLIQGKERFWIMYPQDGDEESFQVELGTREAMERVVRGLTMVRTEGEDEDVSES